MGGDGRKRRLRLYPLAVLALCALTACANAARAQDAPAWPSADTIVPPDVPDNPPSPVRIELGRRLFYDADLSFTGAMSCATCHDQKRGFAGADKTHPGVFDDPGERNVQTLANLAWFNSLTWGGPQVDTLEHQALIPIEGVVPIEMGFGGRPEGALPQRLKDQACYPPLFAAAFPERDGEISMDTITMALAAFQRTLISLESPYDRYRRGDANAMSAAAERGEALFHAKQCSACHAGVHFSDAALAGRSPREAFHALSPPEPGEALKPDTGLHRITQRPEDIYRFRTPGLRNVALSAPYMHDGEAATLFEAVRRHFEAADRQTDARLKQTVSDAEMADLIAFLEALTDPAFISNPDFAAPPAACPIRVSSDAAAIEKSASLLHNSLPGP